MLEIGQMKWLKNRHGYVMMEEVILMYDTSFKPISVSVEMRACLGVSLIVLAVNFEKYNRFTFKPAPVGISVILIPVQTSLLMTAANHNRK